MNYRKTLKPALFLLINLFFIAQSGFTQKEHLEYSEKAKDQITLGNFDKAKSFSDTAITLVREINQNTVITFLNRALVFNSLRTYDSTEYYLKLTTPYYENDTISNNAAIYNQLKGALARHNGEYEKCVKYFSQELEILQRYPKNVKQKSACLINLATAQMLYSKYSQAIENFNNSLKLSRSIADTTLILKALINNGVCYSYLKNHQKSAEFQEEALDLARLTNKNRLAYFAIANLGTQYDQLEQYTKSKYYLKLCLENTIVR